MKASRQTYGLIGYPLSHSFSKRYFSEKFAREGLAHHAYELFPLPEIGELTTLLQNRPDICGLNVTIPYKEAVLPYLDHIDPEAKAVGAVNTIRITENRLEGYNTDVYGFGKSLSEFCPETNIKALVLGSGGASKAVQFVLHEKKISFLVISRSADKGDLTYEQVDERVIRDHRLIVQTTPLGMHPHVNSCPEIPYSKLGQNHYLYDLVYNPETTRFLELGLHQKAKVMNGLSMLHLQAEKAWTTWAK